jgi:hypothetical protein
MSHDCWFPGLRIGNCHAPGVAKSGASGAGESAPGTTDFCRLTHVKAARMKSTATGSEGAAHVDPQTSESASIADSSHSLSSSRVLRWKARLKPCPPAQRLGTSLPLYRARSSQTERRRCPHVSISTFSIAAPPRHSKDSPAGRVISVTDPCIPLPRSPSKPGAIS